MMKLQNIQGDSSIDPKLQELLSQLEASLRSVLNRNNRSERGNGDAEPNVNGKFKLCCTSTQEMTMQL